MILFCDVGDEMNINNKLVKALLDCDYSMLGLYTADLSACSQSSAGQVRPGGYNDSISFSIDPSDLESNESWYKNNNNGFFKGRVDAVLGHDPDGPVDIRLFNALYVSLVHVGGVEVAVELHDRFRDHLTLVSPNDEMNGYCEPMNKLVEVLNKSKQLKVLGSEKIILNLYPDAECKGLKFNKDQVVDLVVDAIDRFTLTYFEKRMSLLAYDVYKREKIESLKRLKLQINELSQASFQHGYFPPSLISLFHVLNENCFNMFLDGAKEIAGVGWANSAQISAYFDDVMYPYDPASKEEAQYAMFMLLTHDIFLDNDDSHSFGRVKLRNISNIYFGENGANDSGDYQATDVMAFIIASRLGDYYPKNRIKDIFHHNFDYVMEQFEYDKESHELAFIFPDCGFFYEPFRRVPSKGIVDLVFAIKMAYSMFIKKNEVNNTAQLFFNMHEYLKVGLSDLMQDIKDITVRHCDQFKVVPRMSNSGYINSTLTRMHLDNVELMEKHLVSICVSEHFVRAIRHFAEGMESSPHIDKIGNKAFIDKVESVLSDFSQWIQESEEVYKTSSELYAKNALFKSASEVNNRYYKSAFSIADVGASKAKIYQYELQQNLIESKAYRDINEKALMDDNMSNNEYFIDNVL